MVGQTGTKLASVGQLTIYKDGHIEEALISEVPEPEDSGEGSPENGDEYGGIRSHSNKVKTRMWMPHIDDMVLCLYLPIRNGDGFILGKIWQ